MSNKHKIFGHHPRQGIQTIQGRNAQVTMPKVKNHDFAESTMTQKHQLSPFSGYSFIGSQNMLATSQVGQFNPQAIRKIIKQQLQRSLKQQKNKSELNIMKTEIKSIKEKVQQLSERENIDEETERAIQSMMRDIIQKYKVQTALNLRQVVKKIDQNIKKECIALVNKQAVSESFVEEIEKQFNDLDDRLQMAQSKLQGNSKKTIQDPVVLAQTIQLRMRKIQRQIEHIKKITLQGNIKIKQQIAQKQSKWEQQELAKVHEEMNSLIKQYSQFQKQTKKNIVNLQHTKATIQDINNINNKIKKVDEEQSLKIVQLSKKYSTSSVDLKEFLNSSKNLATSAVFEGNEGNKEKRSTQSEKVQEIDRIKENVIKDIFISPKIQKNMSSPQKHMKSPQKNEQIPTIKISSPSVVKTISSPEVKREDSKSSPSQSSSVKKSSPSVQKQDSTLYKIDNYSFLMDSDGNYITDSNGNMIRLQEEHLRMLRQSNLVKFEQ